MKKHYKNVSINSSKNTHETIYQCINSERQYIKKILDIPCGHGAFSLRLKDNHFNVISSDVVPDILKINNSEFVLSDLNSKLPFEENTFDCITCIDGIAHVENIPHTLREFNRVLKNDALILISTPNISSLRSRFRYFLTGFHNKRKIPLNELDQSPEHLINIIDFPMIRYFLHTNGFELISVKSNNKKSISSMYSILLPIIALVTLRSFTHEKHPKEQKSSLKTIYKSMFSRHLLFGETLIIKAKKRSLS